MRFFAVPFCQHQSTHVIMGQSYALTGSGKLPSDGRAYRYEAASQVSLEQS